MLRRRFLEQTGSAIIGQAISAMQSDSSAEIRYRATRPSPEIVDKGYKEDPLVELASELETARYGRGGSQQIVAPPRKTGRNLKIGGISEWDRNQVEDFDKPIRYNSEVQTTFFHFGNNNSLPIERFIRGKDQNVYLEFMNYDKDPVNQPEFSYDAILSGAYDNIISNIISQAKQYAELTKCIITFIPFSEFNGNWTPTGLTVNGNNNDGKAAEKHIKAFHKIRTMIDRSGSTLIKLAWSPNAGSVPDIPENQMEAAFPGTTAVDAGGISAFSGFGGVDIMPDKLISPVLDRLVKLGINELAIYSTGQRVVPGNPQYKRDWLRSLFEDLPARHPLLKLISYFQIDKEQHWPISISDETADILIDVIRRHPEIYNHARVLRPSR